LSRSPAREPPLPPGAGALATGDGGRIAYGVLPAGGGAARAAPVVALHGGPGVPDTAGLLAALAPLTADGHDVWSYDQRGTGRSSRLDDPRGYTTELAVADLEAVRRRTGAPRIILVGHSYGAYLAAAYHDAHPDRVERLVLSSPGALSAGGTGGDPLARLDPAGRREVQRLLVSPRALLVYGLVQVDPASAHALTGDAEVDARQDRVHAATAPALHCPGHAPQGLHGNGFFANQVPQSLRRPVLPPLERSADDARVPALVLKGRCDYLDWASAVEHLDAFPGSRLVYLPDAGHDSYRERPDAVVGAVRAFLGGGDVPGVLADPRTAPADYQRR
jgi:proline iminopeptidase